MTLDRLKSQFSSFDSRLYQIASLGTLLCYGLFGLRFDVAPWQVALTFGAALLTQYAGTRWDRLPAYDPLSAIVSAIGLCIFLRTNDLLIAALASFIAIGCKFLVRWRNKHIFNPTNFSLVVMMATGFGWISPDQRQAETLAALTGWNIEDIRKAMNIAALPLPEEKKWYQRLWVG